MPPRPQGTDGSDHSYRMVIAERYKRMADYKHSITRLLGSHVALMLVRGAWSSIGHLEGHPYPVHMIGLLGGEVAVIVTFIAAKLGNVKESLTLLKVYNVLQCLVGGMLVLVSWRYHTGLNMEERLYSKIAERHILSKTTAYSQSSVSQAIKSAELTVDMVLAAFMIIAVVISHRMIQEKMQLKKEAAERGAGKRAGDAGPGGSGGDGDEAPQAVPLDDDEDRRVTAKASTRRRARMA